MKKTGSTTSLETPRSTVAEGMRTGTTTHTRFITCQATGVCSKDRTFTGGLLITTALDTRTEVGLATTRTTTGVARTTTGTGGVGRASTPHTGESTTAGSPITITAIRATSTSTLRRIALITQDDTADTAVTSRAATAPTYGPAVPRAEPERPVDRWEVPMDEAAQPGSERETLQEPERPHRGLRVARG
jgi:hypothetical protein